MSILNQSKLSDGLYINEVVFKLNRLNLQNIYNRKLTDRY